MYGLGNRRIQGRLLETKDLTFEKALQTAVTMETCERETHQLRENSASIHYLHGQKKTYRKPKKTSANRPDSNKKNTKTPAKSHCYRCGNKSHKTNT